MRLGERVLIERIAPDNVPFKEGHEADAVHHYNRLAVTKARPQPVKRQVVIGVMWVSRR